MLPSESNRITGPEQRRIMTTTASDIGIFSGKEKKRLELSNDELDPTHKFAIALFEEAVNTTDPNPKMDKKGVYVHLRKNDKGVLMTDVADISSIAKRLGLSEDEVRESANEIIDDHTRLDEKIQKIVNDYEKQVKAVKEFIVELKSLSQNFRKVYNPQALKEFKGKLNDIGNVNSPLRECVVDNGEVLKLLSDFYEDSSKSLEKNLNMIEFQGKLEKFEAKLAKLDQNFALNAEIPREKVTEDTVLWYQPGEKKVPKNHKVPKNLCANCTAEKIKDHPDSGDNAVRLKLGARNSSYIGDRNTLSIDQDDKDHFAIKTDGYIYHQEPKASDKFAPYTKDGKSWILLNIDSLHYRTGISKEKIKEAVNSPDTLALDKLIHLKLVEEPEKQELEDLVRGFQMRVNFNSEGVKESMICDEIKKKIEESKDFHPYKDFDSFLDRFKELSNEDLVKELSILIGVMGYSKLAAQLMRELGDKAVNSAVKSESWDAFNQLISLFVDLNLDLNKKIDDKGNTLLHLAIINEQKKAIEGIAKRNSEIERENDIPVKIDIKNNAGKTAKDLIIEKYGEDYFDKLNF